MSTGKDFGSDNAAPAHPAVLAALAKANDSNATSYGDDPWTARLRERMSELFGRKVWTFPTLTGTGANSIALATMTPPYGAIFCHEEAHILVDECGAVEMVSGGARLVPVAGEAGRISLASLEHAVARFPRGVMHNLQPAALSLTQGTECGTLYRPGEIAALAGFARASGLKVHMDGARFANAVASTGASPAALSVEAGVDVLCFGATKNGAMAAEAMVFFDEALADRAIYFQKRGGQVASKMRYVSAQLLAMFENDLWLENARTANARAFELSEGAIELGLTPRYPAEINEVFLPLSASQANRLRAEDFRFLSWGDGGGLGRFVTSYATEKKDVDALLVALKAATK